jgi:hypothetical protein
MNRATMKLLAPVVTFDSIRVRVYPESEGEISDRCRLPLRLVDLGVLAIPVCLKRNLFSKVWRRGSRKSESDTNDVYKDEYLCD